MEMYKRKSHFWLSIIVLFGSFEDDQSLVQQDTWDFTDRVTSFMN